MNEPVLKSLLAAFLLTLAVAAAIAALAVRNLSRSAAAADWVNHTHAVILEVRDILATARIGDAALRAFAATGSSQDRAACREAFSEMAEHLEIARALTRAEPAQHAQFLRLETLANRRATFAQSVLAARQSGPPESVAALLAADDGAATLAELGRAVTKLRDDEMALLAARDTAAYVQAQTTRWTAWLGVTLNFLLLTGAAWMIHDHLAARRRVTTVLEQAQQQLEAKVNERTAELARANDQLSADLLERRWANEALQHQLHYHQLIENSINDAVLVITKALHISRINSAVVHLTGHEAHQLVNQPLSTVVRLPDDLTRTSLIDPLSQALREGHDVRDLPGEVKNRLGTSTLVHFTLFPLRDGDKVVGGIVILRPPSPTRPAIL